MALFRQFATPFANNRAIASALSQVTSSPKNTYKSKQDRSLVKERELLLAEINKLCKELADVKIEIACLRASDKNT